MTLFITELSEIVQVVHIVQIVFLFLAFCISTGLKTRVGQIQVLMQQFIIFHWNCITAEFAEEYKFSNRQTLI